MFLLFIISLVWAFSFGFTKEVSTLDPNFIAFVRLSLSLPLFVPFFDGRHLNRSLILKLIGIGAIEYGVFYCLYNLAYRYLAAYQVALFTVFIPLYVTLFGDWFARKLRVVPLLTSLLAALGAAWIVFKPGHYFDDSILTGFLLVQGCSVCFAFGQVCYQEIRINHPLLEDHKVFALLYAGAVPVTAIAVCFSEGWHSFAELTVRQSVILAYLGVVASGLCFFGWNKAAVRVSSGTLAAFNNLKIPLAVLVSICVFGETADYLRLFVGGGVILLAILIAEYYNRQSRDPS